MKKLEENQLSEAEKSFALALREKTDFIPAVISLSKIFIGKDNQWERWRWTNYLSNHW